MAARDAGTRRPGPAGWSAWGAAALLALLLPGCGMRAAAPAPGTAPPPPAPPRGTVPAPPRPPTPGYIARADSLDDPARSVLRGRRIALDPGHGGSFPGAVGVGGTTEKAVNLAVALALRDLLRERGAEVFMTREDDRDFVTRADSALRADLAVRADALAAWRPEVMVSIHHNADPAGRHDVNESQVYFQMGDDGAAHELGHDLHRAFARNLSIEPTRLLPGNFFMLRTSLAPAVLSEASYITQPDVEARLRTPAARRLEAEALLLGLVRWFSRQRPVVATLMVDGVAHAAGDTARVTTGSPTLGAQVRGAFDLAALRIGGDTVLPRRHGDRLEWSPATPLPAGVHEAKWSLRLAGEGAAPAARLHVRVEKPAVALRADTPWQRGWDETAPVAVRVQVLDGDGLPLPGGARVRIHATPGALVPRDTVVEVVAGEAWAYFHTRRPVRHAPGARARFDLALEPPGPRLATLVALPAIARHPESPPALGFLRVMPADTVWRGRVPAEAAGWLNRDGFARLDSGRTAPRLPGFRPWGGDTADPLRQVAIARGLLAGRRIVLDPEGGGEELAGLGRDGLRAAPLNLEVARALAGMLEAAGAEVRLTRERDAAVSEVERVLIAEDFAGERFVRIAHRPGAAEAGHYFASGGGRRWARALAAMAPALGLDSVAVVESARYPVAQVAAVALDANLLPVDRAADRLAEPGIVRRHAYALFAALVVDLHGAPLPTRRVVVRDALGQGWPGALVRVGAGGLLVQAGPGGALDLAATEPGRVGLEVLGAGAAAQPLPLDFPAPPRPSSTR